MGDVGYALGEGDERRRDVQPLEGAAHGVLAPNGGDAKVHLGVQGAQERRGGQPPSPRVRARTAKVLLKAQVTGLQGDAHRGQAAQGLHHCSFLFIFSSFLSIDSSF